MIRLSPKYGVNPSLSSCYYCGDEKNEVVLPGMLKGDEQAPHRAVWSMEPCDTCRGYMAQGIMLLKVADGSERDPVRLGPLVVITEDAARRMLAEPMLSTILKARVAHVPASTWAALGLPEPTTDGKT